MFQGIISSIIATIVAAVVIYLYRRGYITEWSYLLQGFFDKWKNEITPNRQLRLFIHDLVRRIISDQSRQGVHFGQFGKSVPYKNTSKYQKNPENLSVKPNMYLTFWPGVIFKKHGLAPHALYIAVKGIQQLFVNNRISVRQSIVREMRPEIQPEMISYRHTISGALFLYHQISWNPTTISVIDLMLDSDNRWQNEDGGWAHSNRDVTESDLWGSAYALNLLNILLSKKEDITPQLHSKGQIALSRTLDYLNKMWTNSKWQYGGASSEENCVQLFIEIAPILKIQDPSLFNDVKQQLLIWLSPAGGLKDSYVDAYASITRSQIYARIAYALYRADEKPSTWMVLYKHLLEGEIESLYVTELAFALDLSYEYQKLIADSLYQNK